MGDFQTFIKVCGTPNPAGTKAFLWVQKIGAIADPFPAPTGTPSAAGDTKVLTGAFTYEVGEPQGFVKIPIVPDSGQIEDNLVGNEPGSQGIESFIDFRIAGTKKEQLEFYDTLVSFSGCMVAILQTKAGEKRVLGDKDNPASVESLQARTGQVQGDPNGATIRLKSSMGVTAPILDEAVTIAEI